MAKVRKTDENRKRALNNSKKYTGQGSGKFTRFKNKHKRRNSKRYRGQGR